MYDVYVRFITASGMSVTLHQDVTTVSNAFGAVSAVENRVHDKYPDASIKEMKVEYVPLTKEDEST